MCAKQKKPVKAKTPPPQKNTSAKDTAVAYLEEALFPVAAIGASAGGIEAISLFLAHLRPDLGIAYVIIQHLSSDHKSILPDLLTKRTPMKVHQVKDGMKIQPDKVYVIPPAVYMTIMTSHLPVIILSATPHLKVQIKQAGADAFLEKPFSNNDLLQIAGELINGH